jgi:hypothetical protein
MRKKIFKNLIRKYKDIFKYDKEKLEKVNTISIK